MSEVDDLLESLEATLADSPPQSRRRGSGGALRSARSTPLAAAARAEPVRSASLGSRDRDRDRPAKAGAKADDDLDALLDMLSSEEDEGDDGPAPAPARAAAAAPARRAHKASAPAPAARAAPAGRGGGRKCTTVMLGGAEARTGASAGISRAACDNLRCTSCDFRVLRFPGHAWGDEADYLFFRNNMPDEDRLASQLRPARAAAAYCCQCSWDTAAAELRPAPGDVRWVCGGH